MFKECYALEKIHGTSAHVSYKLGELKFFSGGVSHERFVELFDAEALKKEMHGIDEVTVFGEAYGGKCQGMSDTYGKELKFIVFDVQISGLWLAVPQAKEFASDLGLEFVSYVKIPAELEAIDAERDKDSVQAVRNGIGEGKKREGIVLRPLIELRKNNDSRIVVKHKGEEFGETKTPRKVADPEQLKILEDAQAVAEEWVTPMRLRHVLDKIDNPCMEKMRDIIRAMADDVEREGKGEIVWSKAVEKAIGKATALATKDYFKNKLVENHG